jgi:D-3-phosphoglycerate dehydrogenase
MDKVKVLLVSDGGITEDLMQKLFELEEYGAEVTMIADTDMHSMDLITDRMFVLEYQGIDATPTLKPLLDVCGDKEVICVHVASINKEIINASKKLKLVACMRGGIENVDLPALTERDIKCINSPWRSANAVADFTVGMMIAENKNIARSHKAICEGKWRKVYTNSAYIHDMRTRTVGVIGCGHIGSRVISRLVPFGCRIIVYDPFRSLEDVAALGYEAVTMEQLLAQSDFVTIHLRLSDKTEKFFGEKEFAQMKPTAYFLNISRAGIVDNQALLRALQTKSIGGAALDVFDEEPLPPGDPFTKLDNVTLTSHMAGTSNDTMRTSVEIAFDDIVRYLKGEPLLNLCN